ncbi:MAG TPA: TonB-dependent receptor [Rhizomicrobium sp.]|nr:TonB-dependent receptor [Rhizomicrobium sp.]
MAHRRFALALGLLGATMLTPADAQTASNAATDSASNGATIETVTITARRKAEDLERVPVAVTAISPDAIRQENIRTAIDLQELAPSLTVTGNLGSRDDNVFTIRGQSQPFGGADPGVQTYFNEVPFGAGGPGNYYDMDSIQVLRGPQGTLFGRNTTGGAVLFQPKKPSDEFGGYIDGQTGNYGMYELEGAVNVPVLDDKLMVRAAGDIARRDGFTQDLSTLRDTDNVDYEAFRVGVTVKPIEGFENYTAFSYLNNHDNGTGAELTAIAPEANLQGQYGPQVVSLITAETLANIEASMHVDEATAQTILGGMLMANPTLITDQATGLIHNFYASGLQAMLAGQQALGVRQITSTIPLFYKRHVWSITDIARYDFSNDLRIRNIFGYLSDKTQSAFDYDGSMIPLLEIPNARTWEQNSRQITEELQVQGEQGGGAFNWLVGFYYEHDYRGGYAEVERDVFGGGSGTGPFGPLGSTEVDVLANGGSSLATYANITVDASDWVPGLSLTGGGRFTWDHKVSTAISCLQSALLGDPPCPYPVTSPPYDSAVYSASFHAPTWNVSANWQASDDTLLYASWRRGYKSGGFNSGGAGAAAAYLLFKPEYLTDVELGTKNNWEILGVPGRTNFDLYYGWYNDVQKNDIVNIVSPIPTPPIVLTVNAAKATIKGLEFESTFIPDENFQVTAFYSYTDASYDSFKVPAALDGATGTILGIDDHAGAPFAFTPRHKLGATARFHLPVDGSYGMPYLSATWYWQSKVWFTDMASVTPTSANPFDYEPDAFQGDYGLINLRLDWNSVLGSPIDASAFVNNLGDRTYKTGANALEHQIGTTASIFGAPRMFGVELRFRFGEDAK